MVAFAYFGLGVFVGLIVAAVLVRCVGRESSERGGTLTFDSLDARAVFKHRREASQAGVWTAPHLADCEIVTGRHVRVQDQPLGKTPRARVRGSEAA